MYSTIGKIGAKLVLCYVAYKTINKVSERIIARLCEKEMRKAVRRTADANTIYTTFVEGD